jgi:hypothetical protein
LFLETLQAWTDSNLDRLANAGVTVKLSEPSVWDKSSQGVILSTPLREGEVWVWASGECDVILADVAAGEPEQTHHDLSSQRELLDVLDSFRERFLTVTT